MARSSGGTPTHGRVPPPLLDLSKIKDSVESRDEDNTIKMCNTYGFFLGESTKNSNKYWNLGDEHLLDGYDRIKLCGPENKYPTAQPGDIVRIHRLCFDRTSKLAYIPSGANVVVWKSFLNKPEVLHSSERPTFCEIDEERRKHLETIYGNLRTSLHNFKNNNTNDPHKKFFRIAGRVESKEIDKYNHLLIHVNDGTDIVRLRLFKKNLHHECNDHYEVGLKFKDGNYLIASNVKRNGTDRQLLDLSANLDYGRSLRFVESGSILGNQLFYNLKDKPINNNNFDNENKNNEQSSNNDQQQQITTTTSTSSSQQLRRSPRLNPLISSSLASPNKNQNQNFPKYTKLSDIQKKPDGKYDFYDIVGQVRGQPHECEAFKNWVFQLYDGSTIGCDDGLIHFVKEPIENCLTIIVYSTQKEQDVDVHIKKVQTLNDGDLVMIKNIKAIWRYSKLKLELHPNINHDKGITVIEKESDFGRYLWPKLTLPPIDDEQLYEE